MPIFEIGDDTITPVKRTSFAEAGMKERADLQRLLRANPEVVAENVLIISEEFGEWTDSRRRIDLLGVDKKANLVVIELKRTEDGGHMELQALRYAAMVSTLTAARAVEILGKHLRSCDRDDDPEQILLDFLDWEEVDEDEFGQDVRIILVSADFSREVTTSVLWLNEKDLDISCVRIRPYAYGGRTLIDVQQVIPLPEAADYQIQVREKKRQERRWRRGGKDFTRYDITICGKTYPAQWKRNAMLIIVKQLAERGVGPADFQQAVAEIGRKRLWLSIDLETPDVDEFLARAASDADRGGVSFDPRRWHLRPDDLIVHDGKTHALTNQWGVRWPRTMELVEQTYPELELEWTPSEKGEGA